MELRLLLLDALKVGHGPESVYSFLLLVVFLGFLAATHLPFRSEFSRSGTYQGLVRPTAFRLAVVTFIFSARLPGLLPPLLNPDEGVFTAAAARLLDDPVFWRSVDTGSSGPLNIFPLTLPALLGFVPDLASSRLIGLAMMTASVVLLHAALGRLYGEATARLATLPVVTTVAFMQAPNFVHYSSEHCPILLLSGMLYLLCRVTTTPAHGGGCHGAVFTVGFLGGLMPFAKMQGLPIAFALCLILVHALWLRHRKDRPQFIRPMAWLVLGGVLPFLLAAAYLSVFSIWDLFWNSYIQTNLFHYSGFSEKSAFQKLHSFVLLIVWAPSLAPLTVASLLFLGIVAVQGCLGLRDPRLSAESRRPPYVAYAVVYLLAAAFAVAKPGNPFRHYLLLLLMPMGFLLGTILGEARRVAAAQGSVLVFPAQRVAKLFAQLLLVGTAATVGARVWQGGDFLALHERYLQNFRGPVAQAIRRAAEPGSTIAVWGFSPGLIVESGMVQGTRFGFSVWQIERNPLQQDFINEYVRDLNTNRPEIFVDAIAPGMFYYPPIDRKRQGHDALPAIAALIDRDYRFTEEVQGVRVYRRKLGS